MFAIPDLGGIALCVLALGLLLAVKGLANALHGVFNVGIAGIHPFAGIAAALESTLISWLDDAIKGVESITAKLWHDLAGSLQLLAGLTILLGDGIIVGLEYLWNHALPAFVKLQTDLIRSAANEAKTLSNALVGSVAQNLKAAERYAEGQADSALSAAQSFTRTQVSNAVSAIRSEIGQDIATVRQAASDATTAALRTAEAGIVAAEQFAASAAGAALRTAEGEIGIAEQLAAQGIATAEQIAAAGVAGAERAAGSALAQSEAAAKQALAQSEAIGAAALAGVKGIAVGVGDELKTIEGTLGAAGVAGLIASIPAIATLVTAIATEAGLDSAACRAKNKQICGVDPLQWAGLLGGLGLMTGLVSLREIEPIARGIAHATVGLIREAA